MHFFHKDTNPKIGQGALRFAGAPSLCSWPGGMHTYTHIYVHTHRSFSAGCRATLRVTRRDVRRKQPPGTADDKPGQKRAAWRLSRGSPRALPPAAPAPPQPPLRRCWALPLTPITGARARRTFGSARLPLGPGKGGMGRKGHCRPGKWGWVSVVITRGGCEL